VSGKRINLVGQRFGRLVVLRYIFSKKRLGYGKSAYWECQCDCGVIKNIGSNTLRRGNAKSCGCYQHDCRRLAKGEAAFNSLYADYQRSAKRRDLIFLLSTEDFRSVTKQNCHYCGAEPAQILPATTSKGLYGNYIHNGIDRVDNTKGYELNNTVPCCK